jgi:hypothetical protein
MVRVLFTHAPVIPLTEGRVTLTREQMPDLPETHVEIHLRVPAARHVEDVARLDLLLDIHFHATAHFPERLTVNKGLDRRLATHLDRELPRLLDRRAAHGVGNGFLRDLTPWLTLSVSVHMLQNRRLDATAFQHRMVVESDMAYLPSTSSCRRANYFCPLPNMNSTSTSIGPPVSPAGRSDLGGRITPVNGHSGCRPVTGTPHILAYGALRPNRFGPSARKRVATPRIRLSNGSELLTRIGFRGSLLKKLQEAT